MNRGSPTTASTKLAAPARKEAGRTKLRRAPLFTPRLRTASASVARLSRVLSAAPEARHDSPMLRRLKEDKSPFALRPRDPSVLERIAQAITAYADFGANDGTKKGERSAWNKYWLPFMTMLRSPPWRTNEAIDENPHRESSNQVAFTVDTWQRMLPRRKADGVAQVDSAINVLNHVRRMHSRKGYRLPPAEMLAHVARGMRKETLLNYGKHYLLPVRVEPFTAGENTAMKSLEGKKVNKQTYDGKTPFWRGWRCVDTFADQTGERKHGILGHDARVWRVQPR